MYLPDFRAGPRYRLVEATDQNRWREAGIICLHARPGRRIGLEVAAKRPTLETAHRENLCRRCVRRGPLRMQAPAERKQILEPGEAVSYGLASKRAKS